MHFWKSLFSARGLLWFLVALACVHIAYYYPHLPERVASHFGPTGKADRWMHKSEFATFYVVLVILTAALLGGLGELLRHIPDDLINLPNKDYWFAPARHDRTMQRITASMATFGVATMILLIAIMHLCILANVDGSFQLSQMFFPFFGVYIVYVLLWTFGLMRSYNNVPQK